MNKIIVNLLVVAGVTLAGAAQAAAPATLVDTSSQAKFIGSCVGVLQSGTGVVGYNESVYNALRRYDSMRMSLRGTDSYDALGALGMAITNTHDLVNAVRLLRYSAQSTLVSAD